MFAGGCVAQPRAGGIERQAQITRTSEPEPRGRDADQPCRSARARRRFPPGAASVSAKSVSMRLKAMLTRSVVPSLEGTWCRSQDGNITDAARLRLRDAGIGGDAADRGGSRHDEDRPRVLEDEVRAGVGHGDIVDAAEIVVRMIVGRMIGAGRIDIGPATRDHQRKLLDLQVLRDALARRSRPAW